MGIIYDIPSEAGLVVSVCDKVQYTFTEKGFNSVGGHFLLPEVKP